MKLEFIGQDTQEKVAFNGSKRVSSKLLESINIFGAAQS